MMLVFWFVFLSAIALQYFFPLAMYLEADGPLKTLKKCFLLLADNLGVSFFLFVRTILDFALSVLTAMLIPGIAGISLSHICLRMSVRL